jgi:hypothetical protein
MRGPPQNERYEQDRKRSALQHEIPPNRHQPNAAKRPNTNKSYQGQGLKQQVAKLLPDNYHVNSILDQAFVRLRDAWDEKMRLAAERTKVIVVKAVTDRASKQIAEQTMVRSESR